jgi:ABC-type nitrate/sulfonate/bicarbonate transport system substrate-binding protein
VDLGVIGPGAALIPVKDGKDTSIIYNHVGNGLVALAGNKNITNAGQCKRVATLNPGSSMYGWAVAFKSGFSANYDVVPLGDIPSILAALTSGSTDCATLTVPQMSKPAADGTVKVLADPRNGSTMPKSDAIPVGLHEGAIWGLKSKLAGKEEALVRFTRAMDKALRFIKDNDDLTLAGLLRKENDIALTGDEKFLAGVIAENRYSFGPHGGLIDEKDWQACLTFLKASGLTFIDANDPKWGFDARVDMSFLEKGRTRG